MTAGRQFGWEYPPGVTGNEPQIAGEPVCGRCGHDAGEHGEESSTEQEGVVERWPGCQVDDCYCEDYIDPQEWLESKRDHYRWPDA